MERHQFSLFWLWSYSHDTTDRTALEQYSYYSKDIVPHVTRESKGALLAGHSLDSALL